MHEYLRDTLEETYAECKSCKTRTEYTCIRCGYCWSCHWKQEQTEKFQFRPFILSNNNNDVIFDPKHSFSSPFQSVIYGKSKSLLTNIFDDQKVVDVFGRETGPICNYLRCHHKFSIHGIKANNNCKCQHPQNRITGVAKR